MSAELTNQHLQLIENLPGIYPREMIEAILPLEVPRKVEEREAGLRVSICPGLGKEGEEYSPHYLRAKLVAPQLVDIYCPRCDPKVLRHTLYDMLRERTKESP